jgi:hypothetical protein
LHLAVCTAVSGNRHAIIQRREKSPNGPDNRLTVSIHATLILQSGTTALTQIKANAMKFSDKTPLTAAENPGPSFAQLSIRAYCYRNNLS